MPYTVVSNLLEKRARFLAFVQNRVEDRALAEDILQAAYVRALEKSGTLREEESAAAWFYSVLRNAVTDHYRHRTTENSALDRWAKELEDVTVAHESTREFACGCITHVIANLRPAYAEILRDVDLAEQPLTTYAKQHGLSATNAGVRAHRARAALRKELTRTCGACTEHQCLDCVCKQPAATK
ncbi:MAG: sigma-70 family RNA polymerase sigma factor [Bryocella sp.]